MIPQRYLTVREQDHRAPEALAKFVEALLEENRALRAELTTLRGVPMSGSAAQERATV